ncbi:MAG: DUF2268 domain-containing protein, partial [Defluviitaleaceae bacterium]|nr:DUF2268 domain-containing protein [Defluviitaleaceae bacterium]
IDIDGLQAEFTTIADALPSKDDDPKTLIALYPLCDSNEIVKERQNGVVGASVFGNVIININPLADDWEKWIPFVFAHEYHHNIWGHNWFVLRGGEGIEGTLLEAMIAEGQADLFAASLFPDLIPAWNRPFDAETERVLWGRIKPVLFSTDPKIHAAYMFGAESAGLPWCMGYSFGQAIVKDFMERHPVVSFLGLLDVSAREIFGGGKYGKI